MEGLQQHEPNELKRYKLIVEKCVYFADINPVNIFITRLLLDPKEQYSLLYHEGNTLEIDLNKTFKITSFDLVVGNPPYETDPSQQNNKPLYNLFIDHFIDLCNYLLFVVPSRWFAGGKGLDTFREKMIKRRDIRVICHQENSKSWFPTVGIKGGVNYFLKDIYYNGDCLFNNTLCNLSVFDIVVLPKYYKIINKLSTHKMLDSIYVPSSYFKYRTNDKRLKSTGTIKCFVSSLKFKNRSQYIDSYEFTKDNQFWKVITARAHGQASDAFGFKTVSSPLEIYTDSYISFQVKTQAEAESLLSYLNCKLPNYMLTIRKVSQDISKSTCKWIPLVPLDREWNDEQVFQYFKINPEELV
jgi:site-specific DNA-methyltransferase (adenine-specific)